MKILLGTLTENKLSTNTSKLYSTDFRGLHISESIRFYTITNTRWFKYDRDYLCVNKSQFVPVIFEPPCMYPPQCTY